MRHRVPARHDPHEGVHARGRGRRARRLPPQGLPVEGPRRPPPDDPGRARRLHRAAASASTCARPRARPRCATRPSTWSRRSSTATSSAAGGTTSCRSRRSTASSSPTTRSRAPRCSSRSSSSPARAPAAARRPTSSSSPSCSATAWSWPTPPAARRSTAPTSRRRRGPRTATAAGRRGTTRCSRTTPSSGSACASRSTPRTTQARLLLARVGPAVDAELVDGDPGRPAARRGRPWSPSGAAWPSCTARCARRWPRSRAPLADDARRLLTVAGSLVRQGVWIIGGDGWAYDIGFGGLDHVLSQRPQREHPRPRHRGVLQHRRPGVEVDPPRRRRQVRGRRARRPARRTSAPSPGPTGTCTSPRSSMGANELQTTKALLEADAWPGPSLVIAYSTCIAHGIDMSKSMSHQKDAVKSGYWPLYRFQPSEIDDGQPFKLDSHRPSIPVRDFVATETRFAILERTHPDRAARAGRAGAGRRRRAVALLRAARRHAPHGPPRAPPPTCSPRWRTTPATATTPRSTRDRPRHHLPRAWSCGRPIVASASPAHRRPRHRPRRSRTPAPPPSCCRRCSKRRSCTRRSQLTGALEAGSEHFAEALDYFPAIDDVRRRGRPLPGRPSSASRAASTIPVIASLNATSAGGWVRYAELLGVGRRRRHRAQPLPRRRRPAPDRGATSRPPTSTSSPRCGPACGCRSR